MADTVGVTQTGRFQSISASATVANGPGRLLGIFVAAASATPTIKVWDSLSGAGTVIVDTYTPVAATFYPIPATFQTGVTVTISGTVTCTPFYVQ